MSKLPLNVGLVGGGKGAFIVQPHQKAIHFGLVAKSWIISSS